MCIRDSPYPLKRTIAMTVPRASPRLNGLRHEADLGVRRVDPLRVLDRFLDRIESLSLDRTRDRSIHPATGELLRRLVEVLDLELDPARVFAPCRGLER